MNSWYDIYYIIDDIGISIINKNIDENEIIELIYDKLINMSLYELEKIIKESGYNSYSAIQIYKKYYNFDELNKLTDNFDYEQSKFKENEDEKEIKYYAELAKGIYLDDIKRDHKYLEEIKKSI